MIETSEILHDKTARRWIEAHHLGNIVNHDSLWQTLKLVYVLFIKLLSPLMHFATPLQFFSSVNITLIIDVEGTYTLIDNKELYIK